MAGNSSRNGYHPLQSSFGLTLAGSMFAENQLLSREGRRVPMDQIWGRRLPESLSMLAPI